MSNRSLGYGTGEKVWRAVGSLAHGQENDQNIQPNSEVGQVSIFLKRSDLTKKHTSESPDKSANRKAKFELGHLRQTLPVTNDDNTDVEKELNAL